MELVDQYGAFLSSRELGKVSAALHLDVINCFGETCAAVKAGNADAARSWARWTVQSARLYRAITLSPRVKRPRTCKPIEVD